MKRKIVFGLVVFLLVLQAQAVFAQDYDYQFAEKFAANDIEGIETLLKVNAHKMDLQICLNSVCHSLAWLTLGENPYDLMERALPLNKNRNIIFKAIKFLVANGADLNQNKYKGLYTGAVGSSGFSLYSGNSGFSNILYWATRGNSQPNMAIIKFLLESGADPNSKSTLGPLYCLFIAIDQSNIQLAKLLIDAGCKVDETGWLSLEYKYFKRLPKDSGELSALQYAAYLGEYAIVKLLVEAGAKINYTDNNKGYLASKTAAIIASERKETDIYNYLQSKQVASAPPPSSQPRQTYNDSYDYSPPSSNSSGSSTPSRNTGKEIADSISRAFEAPIENGRYRISGRSEEISFAGIAKSGMVYYKDATGKQYQGTYSIDGERLTINVMNKSYFYSITSKTSFSGHGEAWYRVGY